MKKIIKLIIITSFLVTLCSCSKNNEEHYLIEITGEELINNLTNSDNKFVFALYNSNTKNAQSFLKSLNDVVQNIKTDIYYVDYNHLDNSSAITIYTYDFGNFATNSYYYYNKGNIEIATDYTDFSQLYRELKKVNNTSSIELIPEETKKESINEAEKLYSEGNVSEAFDKLNYAWNLEEAKKVYNQNKYYKLINSWEAYKFIDKDQKEVKYYNLLFISGEKFFYQIITKDEYKDFTKPDDLTKYEKKYYKLKEDILYISDYENGNYKPTYQIISITEERMEMKDLTEEITLSFAERV